MPNIYVDLPFRSTVVDMKKVRCGKCLIVFWVPEGEQGPSYCSLACLPRAGDEGQPKLEPEPKPVAEAEQLVPVFRPEVGG